MDVDLRTATEVIVLRQPGVLFSPPSWNLYAPGGRPLGEVVRTGRGGPLSARTSYAVVDDDGVPVWQVEQRNSFARAAFTVASAGGELLGTVEQENAMFAPQLRIVGVGGESIRLDGGRLGSWHWALQDLAGQPLGEVARENTGLVDMVVSRRSYVVRRGEGLGGALWPLALLSAVCLDIVHDRKARDGATAAPAT